MVVCSIPCSQSGLFSAARGEKDGYFYEGCLEGYGVLKGPAGKVKLKRSGGLDYLVGGEGHRVFPALLTPGWSMEVIVVWLMWTLKFCAEDIWSSIQGARCARP